MAKDNIQKMLDKGAYQEIAAKARKGLKDESGMPYATIYKLLTGKNVSTVKKKSGGKMATPKRKPNIAMRNEYGMSVDPNAPRYEIKDGYMVLKEKSADIPMPKKLPKSKKSLQRKKAGGKVGSGCNRLY
jgi:hypothetical protein